MGTLEKAVVKVLTEYFRAIENDGFDGSYKVTPREMPREIEMLACKIASEYYSSEAEAQLGDEDAHE